MLTAENGEGCETDWVDDAFEASWSLSCELTLFETGELAVDLYDYDGAGDDLAGSWSWAGADARVDLIRDQGGDLLDDERSAWVSVNVEPAF